MKWDDGKTSLLPEDVKIENAERAERKYVDTPDLRTVVDVNIDVNNGIRDSEGDHSNCSEDEDAVSFKVLVNQERCDVDREDNSSDEEIIKPVKKQRGRPSKKKKENEPTSSCAKISIGSTHKYRLQNDLTRKESLIMKKESILELKIKM